MASSFISQMASLFTSVSIKSFSSVGDLLCCSICRIIAFTRQCLIKLRRRAEPRAPHLYRSLLGREVLALRVQHLEMADDARLIARINQTQQMVLRFGIGLLCGKLLGEFVTRTQQTVSYTHLT